MKKKKYDFQISLTEDEYKFLNAMAKHEDMSFKKFIKEGLNLLIDWYLAVLEGEEKGGNKLSYDPYADNQKMKKEQPLLLPESNRVTNILERFKLKLTSSLNKKCAVCQKKFLTQDETQGVCNKCIKAFPETKDK